MKIPEEALQQHIAVLGKTGSGKTFAIKGIVEHLLDRGRRVGVVDPTGAWWGLRSSRDGAGPGFPVLVLGGDHGDLPLPALGGAAVARLLSEQGVNLVADTSALTVGERTRWFFDFASTLYRVNRSPLNLVLDEAHNFAPQMGGRSMGDLDIGKMLHAANTLASGGRSRGIRLAMITQRPQKLHKDALTSADTLIAMRVLAPQDRSAVEDWIKGCGDTAQGKAVLSSLATLQRGEGWVWYPEGGFLQRMSFPAIRTFDSSATPVDGGTVAAPRAAADIDLTEIREALADAVKEAEANDPKALRAQVKALEAELADARAGKPAAEIAVDEAALEESEGRGYDRGRAEGHALGVRAIAGVLERLATLSGAIAETVEGARTDIATIGDVQATLQSARLVSRPTLQNPRPVTRAVPKDIGGGAQRRMLIALAQNPAGLSGRKLSILADVKRGGSTWRGALAAMRKDALVEDDGDTFQITPAGVKSLGKYDRLPTGDALREHWRAKMGNGSRLAVFDEILAAYPKALTPAELARRARVELGGSTWRGHLAFMRGLELVSGRSELRASPELFE
jgi:uncharacterized protein